ncbi:17-beta-hydroxysteroid dehydrogenase type 6-like isoform X2 [Dendrobates tinctorius]|uniref:17-beta-hydroxysteroid dehydrogenase type 6-like isoform X2 n=1 Tax=Dendrobates tinctorius TaxID=92724 RepID=UPI003CCA0448
MKEVKSCLQMDVFGEQLNVDIFTSPIMWLLLLVVFCLIFLYRWHRQSLILENLSDKYVFITGCDTGFGNLLAKQLDKRGMKVLAACLTNEGAENLKKETSSRLQAIILDITDSKSVSAAAEKVAATVGSKGLWGLVNNAGCTSVAVPIEWLKKEDFLKVLNVNLIGMVDVTVHLLHLVRKAQGRIVNVSSSLGRLTFPCVSGYSMSKYGVEAFSDALRIELSDFGVKVSIIEPGSFQTRMLLSVDDNINNISRIWNNLPKEIKDSYGKQYYESCINCSKRLPGLAIPRLYEATNCMEHALTAVHPWTRYSPGWDSKLYIIPISYFPTVLSDYLLCRYIPKVAHKYQPNEA